MKDNYLATLTYGYVPEQQSTIRQAITLSHSGMVYCKKRASSIAVMRCGEYQKDNCHCAAEATKKELDEVNKEWRRRQLERDDNEAERHRTVPGIRMIRRRYYYSICRICGTSKAETVAARCHKCGGKARRK